MNPQVIKYLIDRYNSLNYKKETTCLKYYYKYNNVSVNIYFDGYDSVSLSLNLILIYEKDFYYTPLNINKSIETGYLADLPKEILKRIVYEGHLTQFYNSMEKHILNNVPYTISYLKDKFFRHAIKKTKSEEYLPFWWHMRRVRMSDRTLQRISASADVSEELLRDIQNSNMTVVRTDDPIKRKSLTMILSSHNIVFK